MTSLHCLIVYQTFGFVEKDYNLIEVGGKNFRVTSAPGAIIDGNGQAWWDGQGSNGGIEKYANP